jgi:putative oxidoreductase
MKALFRTSGFGATILRLVLGVIMLAHGTGKIVKIGSLPGFGFSATVDYMQHHLGVPLVLAYAGTLAEFVGGLLLVSGFLTRMGGLLVAVQMAAAAYLGGHLSAGFFSNWFRNATIVTVEGKQTAVAAPEGFEMHLALVGMAIALVFLGGGAFSVDAKLGEGEAPSGAQKT